MQVTRAPCHQGNARIVGHGATCHQPRVVSLGNGRGLFVVKREALKLAASGGSSVHRVPGKAMLDTF